MPTKIRSIRVADNLWHRLKEKVSSVKIRGGQLLTATSALIALMWLYVDGDITTEQLINKLNSKRAMEVITNSENSEGGA